jgi:PAS domain S-box-containing protein
MIYRASQKSLGRDDRVFHFEEVRDDHWAIIRLIAMTFMVVTKGAILALSGLFFVCLAVLSQPVLAQNDGKSVLVLSSTFSSLPANVVGTKGILDALQADGSREVAVYTEFLDAVRLSGPRHQANAVRYLSERYADMSLDIVIALGPQALELMYKFGDRIAADVPVVFSAVREVSIGDMPLPPHFTGLVSQFDAMKTVELALALQPTATELVVVTGAAEFDRTWEAWARSELAPFEGGLTLRFLAALPMDDLLAAAASLQQDSIILYLSVLEDGAGQRFVPRDVAAALSKAASAPVYSFYDTYLGQGIVGGFMDTFESVGAATGEIARRILSGENPAGIGVETSVPDKYIVDWRALQRWGFYESRLPAGTELRYRPPLLWDQHREKVLAALIIAGLQFAFIVALLIERRHRRRVEDTLRESEEATRESEERYRVVAETAADAIVVIDHESTILFANQAARKIFGYSVAEMVGNELTMLMPDYLRRVHQAGMKRYLESGQRHISWEGVEFPGRHKDGSIMSLELSFAEHLSNGGHRFTGIVRDVTERKRTEERLRESEERYRNVVETQSELICRYLPDTTLTFVNEAYCRYFGKSRQELIGSQFISLIPDVARAGVLDRVKVLTERPSNETYQHEVLRPDGTVGWQQWTDHSIPGPDGKVVEIQAVGRDLTDLHRAEEEVRGRREEVAHLTRVAVLGELSGALAHELNQPLTAILSNAQAARRMLARDTPNIIELREILEDIIVDDGRAGEVIRRLRALLKKDAAEVGPVHFNQLTKDVLQLTRSELIGRGVAVRTDLEPSLPMVLGDRIQLQQVVLNLVLNGCEAMDDSQRSERRLTITTRNGDGLVEAAVSNWGRPIEPAMLDRMFEPFVTTKSRGLGLGLSICRTIVEAHGGRIWARNDPDDGATIGFAIPSCREGDR